MPHPTYLISLTNYSTITVTKYFTVDFICTYDMVNYPFDVQNCNASFMPKANSDVFTKLVPLGHPIYQGTLDLMRYQFQTIEYIHDNVISFFPIHNNDTIEDIFSIPRPQRKPFMSS